MPNPSISTVWCLLAVSSGLICQAGCAARGGATGSFEQRLLDELCSEGVPSPPPEDGTDRAFEWSVGGAPHDAGPAPLPAAGPIALADLLAAAEARNPSLAAARSEVGSAAGRAWQASLYPNPRLELSSVEAPFSSGFQESISTLSLTQPIVLGDRLRAAAAAGDAEQAARLAEADGRRREVFGEIAQLYARLLANRQAEALYRELADLGQRTLDTAQSRFEARAAPETEVIRPQIELHQIDVARKRLATEKSAALRQLSLLLDGLAIDAERLSGDVAAEPPAQNLEALESSVRLGHPAILAARHEVDAAAARLDQIKAERVPDFDLTLGAGYKGDADEGIFGVGAGFTLPLWDGRQGDILAARFDLLRSRQELAATESDLLRRLVETHGEYEAARAQLETVRDRIVPAATRSYEQTQESYRAGRAAFLELLDAQRTLTEARATLAELSGAAAVARARIMQIAGAGLEPAPPSIQQPPVGAKR